MFVGVARISLQIPDSGSLKAKRQVLRRVTDRVKARFNASVAEVGDNDLWQRAIVAVAVVGNDQRHVDEQLQKIMTFIDEMYVAPVIDKEMEIVPFGDQAFHRHAQANHPALEGREEEELEDLDPDQALERALKRGERTLAEAEGMAEWDERPKAQSIARKSGRESAADKKKLSLEEAKARARKLRNPRDWEKGR